MADADKDKLAQAAIEAMAAAYAPYSQFQVGAAIEDDMGQIHTGVNVENASYPVGSCAEAGAIAMMVRWRKKIIRIAVAGRGAALCTPCGGCRQRIRGLPLLPQKFWCVMRMGCVRYSH